MLIHQWMMDDIWEFVWLKVCMYVCVCVCMYPKGLRCGLCRVGIHGVYVNLPIAKVKT